MRAARPRWDWEDRLARHLVAHARGGFILAVVLTLAALPALVHLTVDNGIEVWIDAESDAGRRYDELLDTFGSEEALLIVYPVPDGTLDRSFLERVESLGDRLEILPGVRRLQDLVTAAREMAGGPTADTETLRRLLVTSPLLHHLLITPDGRLAATRVLLDRSATGAGARGDLVAAVEDVVADAARDPDNKLAGIELAGPPVLNVALDRASRRDARRFFPLVFLASGVLLALIFRHVTAVLVPFVAVGSGLAWTLALMALSGHSLDMVTVALPSVLWVLGLATSVHLWSATRRDLLRGLDRRRAVTLAIRRLARPCAISAVTTALGFASLTLARMEPVRTMGLFGALGVLLCWITNALVFPYLALRLGAGAPTARSPSPLIARRARRFTDFLVPRSGRVAALSLLLVAPVGLGLARLEADSNVLDFLPPGHPVRHTYETTLPRLTGPYSLEVLLDVGPEPTAADLRRVDGAARALERHTGVARVVSPLDLVKAVQQSYQGGSSREFELPASDGALLTAWDFAGQLLPREMAELWSGERGILRLSVLARPLGSAEHRRLVEALDEDLERLVPAVWHARVTGLVDLLVRLQENLLTSQILSFSAAFLWIVPVLALLLGSASDALVALVPNLLPLAVALGILGWAGLPLDPATLMIAGVAFGIAVDDTVHVLSAYRDSVIDTPTADTPTAAALAAALARVAPPVVLTSAIAALGFAVLALAEFVPLRHFGLLTVLALAVALTADLVLLPALLSLRDGRRHRSENSPGDSP